MLQNRFVRHFLDGCSTRPFCHREHAAVAHITVCLDEVIVSRQNALGQHSDGGQFRELLRTLQGTLVVTVAITYKLGDIPVASSHVTYRTANNTRFIAGDAETLGKVNAEGQTKMVVTSVGTRTSRLRSRSKQPGIPQRKTPCTCRRWRRLRNSNSRQRRCVSECQSRASANTTDRQFVHR